MIKGGGYSIKLNKKRYETETRQRETKELHLPCPGTAFKIVCGDLESVAGQTWWP